MIIFNEIQELESEVYDYEDLNDLEEQDTDFNSYLYSDYDN